MIGPVHEFAVGGQELWIDHVCRGIEDDNPRGDVDFGDAPDKPYPTLIASNGAAHFINPDVFLGRTVDPEPDGQPSLNADRDDANPAFDDEDGVRFLTPVVPGGVARVEVIASTDGFLNAWVDFDRNGVWTNGAPENIFSAEPLNAGVNVLAFNVPADAEPAPNEATYSRWRFSTTHKLLNPDASIPKGEVDRMPNGEVEDHLVFISDRPDPVERLDFGDAPERPYPVTLANGGAYHEINPDVFLGRRVDAEADGQPSPNADRDDFDSALDDEDGVIFLTPLVPGQPADVQVIASTDGWLNAWVDFDRDGAWSPGTSDEIFVGEPLAAGVNVLSFNVPADAKPGPNEPTVSRWRFSTTDKVLTPKEGSPTGATPNGEVEDHLAIIQEVPRAELDFGDAPERPYPTTLANNGAYHEIDPDVFLGRTVDAEPDGQPSPNADRDDLNSVMDDEDGVRFLTPLVPGQPAEVEVVASTDGWLNAWIDFQRDGTWTPGTSDEIFLAQPLVAGPNILTFNVPADAKPGPNEPTVSRWRFSTTDRVLTPRLGSPTGATPNGEVEDHLAIIQDVPRAELDFGDAPERPYPTTLANNGAFHEIDPNVFLGRTVDAEPDGQPSPNADRDDLNSVMDDEDGVRFLTPLVPGQPAEVEVIASTDGWLNAWIDFQRDGTWTPGTSDEIFLAQPLVAGPNVLTFHVPGDALPTTDEPTYSRWRFSTTDRVLTPEGGSVNGESPNGEVEDHILRIVDRPVHDEFDFGDLRDSYGTTLASNGARHAINPEIYLGTRLDAEADGQPSFDAQRDDSVFLDDEDGVHFATPIVPGEIAVVDVVSSANARLEAWADYNQNGVFDGGERIISAAVSPGVNHLRFAVPDSAIPHPTRPLATRFRLSTSGGLGPIGPARDGEVEDYVYMNGDVNGDLEIGVPDIDGLCSLINSGDAAADLNGDGVVDRDDQDYLVHNIIGTHYGDANLDLVFNSTDLVEMFTAGEYEDGIPGNSTWAEGDFNCDSEFDSSDLVEAFKDGAYSAAAVANVASAMEGLDKNSESDDADSDREESPFEGHTRGQRLDLQAIAIDELFGDDDEDHGKDRKTNQDALDRVFAMI